MLKPIPLCPMEPRPADTWPGSLKDIRDRLDDHVNDRSDPHDTLEGERVKEVLGAGSVKIDVSGTKVTVKVPDSLSGFRNDVGFVTREYVWPQDKVAGLVKALSDLSSGLAGKADLESGKVPKSQIPSEFDEVLFYADGLSFINDRGEFGKLYVDMACNKIYRWSAKSFVELASSDAVSSALEREVASIRELLKEYAAKDHDHDDRYVPFTMEVLTDQWDVIPPAGHDVSEYKTPAAQWGDTYGFGTEAWEYSSGSTSPIRVSYDRDERGPLTVDLEKADSYELVAGGQIVRRVVKVRMFEISDGEVVLGDNFPKASDTAFGAVRVGAGLNVDGGVLSSDGQPNVIEKIKANGTALAINQSDKSVDIPAPDAYTKNETDVMLDAKADRYEYSDWTVDDVFASDLVGQPFFNGEIEWLWARTGGGVLVADGEADALTLEFILPSQPGLMRATRTRTDKYVTDHTKRYAVVRPVASGTTYQLSDYAVNIVDLPSSGEYTFKFPPRTGDRVRDFVLKLNVTADPLPTVRLVKHETDDDQPMFEGEDGWSVLELGVNFFGFTESS